MIAAVIGGIGGDNVNEAYDPATNTWTTKAPMPTPRYDVTAGVVSGIIYVIGGTDSGNVLSTVEAYDPARNIWIGKAPMPTARGSHTSTVVNGIIYTIGGFNGNSSLTAVEAFTP